MLKPWMAFPVWTNTTHPHPLLLKSGPLIEFLVGTWLTSVPELHTLLPLYFISRTVITKTGCVAQSESRCDLLWRGQLKKFPEKFIRCKLHRDWIEMQPRCSYIHFTSTFIFLSVFHHYKLIGRLFFFKVDGSEEVFLQTGSIMFQWRR